MNSLLRRISVYNDTSFAVRVSADSERIIEKTVNKSQYDSSQNRLQNNNYISRNINQKNYSNSTADSSSNIFTFRSSDLANANSGSSSNAHSHLHSGSNSTSNSNARLSSNISSNKRASASQNFSSYGGSVNYCGSGASFNTSSNDSASNSRLNFNQNENSFASTNKNSRQFRNSDSNSTSNSFANQESKSNSNTDHQILTRKSDNITDTSFEHGNISHLDDSKESNITTNNIYVAELEYRFVKAGYAFVEPRQTIQLFTKGETAYVTISALMLDKGTGNVFEHFIWKNHQTIEEYLKVEINKESLRPQVNNGLENTNYVSILAKLELSQFVPAFKEYGWTDVELWSEITDEHLQEMQFKVGHILIFNKHRNDTRYGYVVEWEEFQMNIKLQMENMQNMLRKERQEEKENMKIMEKEHFDIISQLKKENESLRKSFQRSDEELHLKINEISQLTSMKIAVFKSNSKEKCVRWNISSITPSMCDMIRFTNDGIKNEIEILESGVYRIFCCTNSFCSEENERRKYKSRYDSQPNLRVNGISICKNSLSSREEHHSFGYFSMMEVLNLGNNDTIKCYCVAATHRICTLIVERLGNCEIEFIKK